MGRRNFMMRGRGVRADPQQLVESARGAKRMRPARGARRLSDQVSSPNTATTVWVPTRHLGIGDRRRDETLLPGLMIAALGRPDELFTALDEMPESNAYSTAGCCLVRPDACRCAAVRGIPRGRFPE